MKQIAIILLIALGCWNCKEDLLDTYSGTDNVYFYVDSDTTMFSFALTTSVDTVISLWVLGVGEMSDSDRPFDVRVVSTNAKEGVNYDALASQYVLPANELMAEIPIHIYREGAQDTTFYIEVEITPNQYFSQELADEIVTEDGVTDTISRTRHVLGFTSTLTPPPSSMWNEAYFGYFSEAKFILFCEEFNLDPASWYSFNNEVVQQARAGVIYLNNYWNLLIQNGDYKNYPKDPDNPYSEDRGYMSLRPMSSFSITIPSEWPDASEITNE